VAEFYMSNLLGSDRCNGICYMAQKLVNIIKQMDPRDPFRIEMTDMLIDKL
jgi:U3 small nucleolar ribonucleoprotein protein IMP3